MEIENINIIKLKEVMLEDKSIYMVFEYAEHDFLVSLHAPAFSCRVFYPSLSANYPPPLVRPSYLHCSSCH